jgi:hypothetical protein
MRQVWLFALVSFVVFRAEARVEPFTITLVREPPKTGGVPEAHVEWLREIVAKLARAQRLPHAVTVTYRSCGTANAYYHPSRHAITICHELWDKRRALYASTGHDDAEIAKLIDQTMAYTVFHELGHAMHHQLELPIIGRIEDAADELATMLLVEVGDDGFEIGKGAAYGHHLALAAGIEHDFWDEHASGAQRGFAIACLLHGADRERTAELVAHMGVPAKRLAKCIAERPRRIATWQKLFGQSQ